MEDFNFIVQNAALNSSPNITIKAIQKTNQEIRLKIQENGKIRKLWQTTRSPNVKKLLNRAPQKI